MSDSFSTSSPSAPFQTLTLNPAASPARAPGDDDPPVQRRGGARTSTSTSSSSSSSASSFPPGFNPSTSASAPTPTDAQQPKRGPGRPRTKPDFKRMFEDSQKQLESSNAQLKQAETKLASAESLLHRALHPFESKCPQAEIKQYGEVKKMLYRVYEIIHWLRFQGENLGMSPTPFVLPTVPTQSGVNSEKSSTDTVYKKQWESPLNHLLNRVIPDLLSTFESLASKRDYNRALQHKVNVLKESKDAKTRARQSAAQERAAWQQRHFVSDPHFQQHLFGAPPAPVNVNVNADVDMVDDPPADGADDLGEDLGGADADDADRRADEADAHHQGEVNAFARDGDYREPDDS